MTIERKLKAPVREAGQTKRMKGDESVLNPVQQDKAGVDLSNLLGSQGERESLRANKEHRGG